MSQVEPDVICHSMLKQVVHDQGPRGEAGKIAEEEGIPFGSVKVLRLDFQNIIKIENLWQFTSLTKLQIDNNKIEQIQGLEKLVNLVWLDLSFNKISKIEGLSSNTKIVDLSLANNEIERIENLDGLTELQTLSLSNNNLSVINDVFYLRPIRFPALRSLSLKGNPVENDEENYPLMPLAILSDLSFLDFKMVDSVLREKGLEKYEIKVLETKDNEIKEIKMREKAELEAKEKQDRVNAFVNHVPQLFDLMYEEDVDGNIINQIPEIMEVVENFKESINKVCSTIVEEGLVRLKTRTAEIDDLLESRNAAIGNANQRATHLVDEFLALQEANASSEDLSKKIDELDNELMEIEVTLNEKIDETIKEFERYFSDMCASFLEYTSGQYTKIREIQALHNERMQEDSQVQLERFIKNDVPDDFSEEVRMRFVDKETVTNALASSHDAHMLAIDTSEDMLNAQVNTKRESFMKMIQDKELTRSRCRYKEIANLLDHFREEMYNLED